MTPKTFLEHLSKCLSLRLHLFKDNGLVVALTGVSNVSVFKAQATLCNRLKEFVILLSFIKYTMSCSAVLSSKLYWVHSVHTSFDKSDAAFPGADSVQITFWSDTQGCSHRFPSSLQNLYGPFSLFHMLKVLTIKENNYSFSWTVFRAVLVIPSRCFRYLLPPNG